MKKAFIGRIFNKLEDAKKYAHKKGYRVIFETSEGKWLVVSDKQLSTCVCPSVC